MATFKTVPTSATALSAGRRAQPLPTKPQLPARSNLVERDSFLFATLRFRFSRNSSDFRTQKFFKNLFSDSKSKFESRFILPRSVSVDSVLTARYVQRQQHWPSSCSSAALLACLPNLHPNCPLISLIDSQRTCCGASQAASACNIFHVSRFAFRVSRKTRSTSQGQVWVWIQGLLRLYFQQHFERVIFAEVLFL